MKMRLKYKKLFIPSIKSITLISKLGHNVKFKWLNLFWTGCMNNTGHVTSEHENEVARKDSLILQIS